jgi:Immunoglobulin domain
MNARTFISRHLRWLNLPTGVLIALLQRSPVVKALVSAGEYVFATPAGNLLKASVATAASLGAVQTLAGATTLSTTTASPLSTTVGTVVSVAFSINGTTSPADSWKVTGELPPGLAFYTTATGGTGVATGTINTSTLYIRGTPTTAGNYSVSIVGYNDPNGTGFNTPTYTYKIDVAAAPGGGGGGGGGGTPPTITTQPMSQTVLPGGSATLTVAASGASVTYQWMKNGTAIAGATADTLTFNNLQAGDSADYTVVASTSGGQVTSRFARLLVANPSPGRLINMSVRAVAGAGGQPLIVGFVTQGGSKQILVRGIGPALATIFSVPGVLTNPKIDVYSGSTNVASNDDWGAGGTAADMSNVFSSVGAFALPDATSKDAATVIDATGARTVHINSVGAGSGIVLVESYELAAGTGRLINVSARNRVGTGADILIAGFVINGNVPRRVLVRAVGPRLADLGVTTALADPRLELHTNVGGQDTVFAANDNWGDEANAALMNPLTPGLTLNSGSKDSAVLVDLPPGAYTALASGVNNTTGEALIEVYDVSP